MGHAADVSDQDQSRRACGDGPLTDGVLLDPGQPVSLAPGGIHLMLMAPPVALAAGEAVTLRLVFEGADAVEIEAPVRAVAPAAGVLPPKLPSAAISRGVSELRNAPPMGWRFPAGVSSVVFLQAT